MKKTLLYYILLQFCLVAFAFGCGDSDDDGKALENSVEACSDGADNDGDGAVDCADAGCKAFCVDSETEVPLDWKTTWVSSQMSVDDANMPQNPGLPGNTLREKIQISIGGEQIRFTFSNLYGEASLPILKVGVAESTGGSSIDKDTIQILTFSGAESVTIDAEDTVTSDPIEWALEPRADIAISIYFDEDVPEEITGHPGARTQCYIADGDAVEEKSFSGSQAPRWYFLSSVDVMTDAESKGVVAFGDSITDGYASTTDGNNRWTDELSLRLLGNSGTENIAVLNHGIGGNCLTVTCLGSSGKTRFEDDALSPIGVEWVILLEGINDLAYNAGISTEWLIDTITEMVDSAHEQDVKVLGGTIMPCEGHTHYTEEGEAIRQEFNEWVRTTDVLDGFIDFDKITRDPTAPTKLSAEVDSGDHLHPGPEGYAIMAEGIDLALFEAQSSEEE